VLKRVHEWAAAAVQHEMGSFDEHAARIAGWGAADVVRVKGRKLSIKARPGYQG